MLDHPDAIVEVVRAQLSDFADLNRFREALSDEEQARARAYKIQEPGDVFTLARGLLRIELSKRLGLSSRDIRFDVRPSGKPDLRPGPTGQRDWRFSVSHTGAHVAIAFTLGADIGIDIERLDRKVNPLDIARRYFTPKELGALEAACLEARTQAFLAGWTRKEAIVKARGHTMAESLATLSVDLDPLATHPHYKDAETGSDRPACRLIAFTFPEHGLIGAVAIRSDAMPLLRIEVRSGTSFD